MIGVKHLLSIKPEIVDDDQFNQLCNYIEFMLITSNSLINCDEKSFHKILSNFVKDNKIPKDYQRYINCYENKTLDKKFLKNFTRSFFKHDKNHKTLYIPEGKGLNLYQEVNSITDNGCYWSFTSSTPLSKKSNTGRNYIIYTSKIAATYEETKYLNASYTNDESYARDYLLFSKKAQVVGIFLSLPSDYTLDDLSDLRSTPSSKRNLKLKNVKLKLRFSVNPDTQKQLLLDSYTENSNNAQLLKKRLMFESKEFCICVDKEIKAFEKRILEIKEIYELVEKTQNNIKNFSAIKLYKGCRLVSNYVKESLLSHTNPLTCIGYFTTRPNVINSTSEEDFLIKLYNEIDFELKRNQKFKVKNQNKIENLKNLKHNLVSIYPEYEKPLLIANEETITLVDAINHFTSKGLKMYNSINLPKIKYLKDAKDSKSKTLVHRF